ncbi:MAG: tRNA (adenosine(37)-N6)-threonylcarbamoyltransferase complex dimerization subunit type 1 TsaB, partial [Oscillospiraceae bacterium]
TLMVMAEDLLKQCGKTVSDLTAVAVAEGPGSFTGVRIGVAAAKGLSWGGQLTCYGVSTLEAMAESLGVWEGHICACMDARRNQVYNALFLVDNGAITRVSEDRAIALTDLKEDLEHIDGPIFLVGDGSSLTHKTLSNEIDSLILPPEHRMHQRAVGVALLAEKKQAAGESGDGNALTPNYLRLSQAERERAEKMQNAK